MRHNSQFVSPAVVLQGADDLLVEGEDIGLAGADALLLGHKPEGVHDRGDVDAHGTLAGTGVTGDADPDSLALQSRLQPAVLQEPQHGMGVIIHTLQERAAAGAGAAMQAETEIGGAAPVDLSEQRPAGLVKGNGHGSAHLGHGFYRPSRPGVYQEKSMAACSSTHRLKD